MRGFKVSGFDRFAMGFQLVLAGILHWLQRKPPKELLVVAVLGFGFLGTRYTALLGDVGRYFVPSVKAVVGWTPDAPSVLVGWSLVLMFIAACWPSKRIAFDAALQLRHRFGIKLVPW